jgi:hypothetical protein
MRMLVPMAALILFLCLNGSMPDFAHLNLAHAEYLMRGRVSTWEMHMRLWHTQDYALWGGMMLACMGTLCTLVRGK